MSTLEPTPVKTKAINSTTLTIAGILLIVLALLFLASPLLGLNRGIQRGTNFPGQFNGQGPRGTGNNGQPFTFRPGQGGTGGNGFQFPGGITPNRQFNRTGLLGLGFLRGTLAIIIYSAALLISLAAAIGMLSLKTWGKILGIFMAVIYLLLAFVSFLPALLFSRFAGGFSNPLNMVLNILHVVLAIAVIVFALIPARKAPVPVTIVTPPASA